MTTPRQPAGPTSPKRCHTPQLAQARPHITTAIHLNSTAGHFYARAQTGDTPQQTTYSTPSTMQRDQRASKTKGLQRPKGFKTEPRAKTNTDCRICKLLERSGTHKRELNVNHYGNFPNHCPQWAKMNLAERTRTSKLAQYCLRCFAPRLVIKRTNCNKHHQIKCYVSSTKKHKFTCLNKTCLKHSWFCQDHVDENAPLLAAHYEEFNLQGQQILAPTSATQPLEAKTCSKKRPKTQKARNINNTRPHPAAYVESDLSPTSTAPPSNRGPLSWYVYCRCKVSCSHGCLRSSRHLYHHPA